MPRCIEWGEERHQECTATADRGYNECADYRRDCCTWWPCSWGCEIVSWFCVAWTWVSNIVCVAWTWITTAVCVVWDTITTVVNAILVTLESILGWLASGLAFLLELLESIPYLGTIIKFIHNFITTIIMVAASLGDFILGALGIRPEKILRVCTVVLRDDSGNFVASNEVVLSLLQLACDIYKRDCNVRIIPSKPFKYVSGFSNAEQVDDNWIVWDVPRSSADILDVPCASANSALGTPTSSFQFKSARLCLFGAWRRITGYGSPVTCFIIRDISDAIGCQITFTDYATIEGAIEMPHPSPRTLGHEVGHACMLGHRCVDEDNANMMATQGDCNPPSSVPPDRINPRINDMQTLLIRASKHVTYF